MRHHAHQNSIWTEIYIFLLGIATAVVFITVVGKLGMHDVQKKIDVSQIWWISDPKIISEKFDAVEHRKGEKVLGLAEPQFTGGVGICNVYAPVPKGEHDKQGLETLGHEMLHCFAGQYHK